jgi:Na+-translocating ferredoxin:NAD+ oxidoreductase RnfC subunit
VTIILKKHIPSSLVVLGHRVLAAYEGHPETCHGCGETGHVYAVCPHRRRTERPSKHERTSIVGNPQQTQRTVDKEENEALNDKRDIDEPREEERTNKEIHEQVASTHYSKTPIKQQHDTGRVSTNRQEIINTSHESTGLRRQNAKDQMELSEENMEGSTSSRTNKDDIQETTDEKQTEQ